MLLNDVHSELNPTEVARIERPTTIDEVVQVVRATGDAGGSLSIAAGRHAMGGQQLLSDGLVLDMSDMSAALELNDERGIARVQAGMQWPQLIQWLEELQGDGPGIWTIRQKQTGADTLSIGGAVAANVHGRGLTMAPFVDDLEALTIVDANGGVRRIDRTTEPELFACVVGGYGMFGVVCEVELRLVRRTLLERVVDVIDVEALHDRFAERIATGFEFGDWQYDIDPKSDGYLQRGVFSCYRPVDAGPDDRPSGQAALSREDWAGLARLAREDKTQVFHLYRAHYERTNGQRYWSDTHQAATYLDNYAELLAATADPDAPRQTLMISELYVPRSNIAAFMSLARGVLHETEVEVLYGTVRLIERDDETLLAWAREPWACTIVNLLVEHTAAGRERAMRAFRGLIDAALANGGSYYLTYHRWATDEQLHAAAHPRIGEFVERKHTFDPDHVFDSDWYRQVREQVARHALVDVAG